MKPPRLASFLLTTILGGCGLITVPAAFAGAAGTPPAGSDGLGISLAISTDSGGKTTLRSPGVVHGKTSSLDERIALGLELPGMIKDSSVSVGLGFARTTLDLPKPGPSVPLPDRMRDLTLDLGYTQPLDATWSATLGTSLGFHSAGSGGFGSKSLGAAFYGLANYAYGPTLTLSGGVFYDSFAAGGINRFGPAFGISWQPDSHWTLAFGFPQTAVIYHVSSRLSFSLLGEGHGGTYYLEKSPTAPVAGRPSLERTKLEYYDTRVGLGVEWQAQPFVTLSLKSGIVLDREYNYRQRHFKVKSDGTAPYLALAVSFNL
jgi:hypothetical protein